MLQAIGLTSTARRELPPVVNDLTFEARPGYVTALLGEPGSGKTTALRLMLELEPGRGVTYFRGRPLHRIPHPGREVGVLLGDVPGHPSRTVRNQLRMLSAAVGVPASRADVLMEVVGIGGLRDRRLGSLSTGMERRVALAAALLADPCTLLLDEPAAGLHSRERAWLHGLLRGHASLGGAVLFTTDDAKEAARYADRVVSIASGRLVADQEAADFARTRLRPRVAVRTPHAARLADVLGREARSAHRVVEIVEESGSRLSVYGSNCAEIGEAAFRHGVLVHQLADETGDAGAPVPPVPQARTRVGTAARMEVRADVRAEARTEVRAESPARQVPGSAPGSAPGSVVGLVAGAEAQVHGGPRPDPRAALLTGPACADPGAGDDGEPGVTPLRAAPPAREAVPELAPPPDPVRSAGQGPAAARVPARLPAAVADAAAAGGPEASEPPGTEGGGGTGPRHARSGRGSSGLRRVRRVGGPLWPLRYELRRVFGTATPLLTAALVVTVSALTSLVLARAGHTPQNRLLAAWPELLPLPPAALGAGLLGSLAFGEEYRYPALAADRGTVPRRLGLLTAKLAVSAALALVLGTLAVAADSTALRLVFGSGPLSPPAEWISPAASWAGLLVGCAWAGLLASGVFRAASAGFAAVLAVPVAVVPLVRKVLDGPSAYPVTGIVSRLRGPLWSPWPPEADRIVLGALRVMVQPVGTALVLSLMVLLCAYAFTGLRGRVRW
ncbi:ATP-binding cassette domain-containing protein [Streptomyces sp. SPB4]|uniref:ATP-binding cassette domain-containing protein n=1 Tax=Streptomyces sp. SPB4 TaxID=2940553 RepID=UPI0024756E5B|nr:ATP-binding cassette domain-containing protein [Streptomyces sp. SPB4]MDH6538206.1 ABC-type multidrug transport system ATPase subunit [Streptomyces sp. SPB4]